MHQEISLQTKVQNNTKAVACELAVVHNVWQSRVKAF